jgi:hypothetical protein
MDDDGDNQWHYASLTLEEPRWPGTAGGQWVAATARSEEFRSRDLLTAMDRLGAQGWELVTFSPAWGDRSARYIFKTRPGSPQS